MTPAEPVRAAGVIARSPSGRLLMQRTDGEGWSWPGGVIKDGETAEEAAQREFFEETGRRLGDVGMLLMRRVKDVDYTTYIVDLKSEFVPVLNHEHNGYMWADPAAALEGEVIPPTPIAKGPLALIVMETKRDYGLRQRDLMVLSSGKDPFGLDTPLGHTLGRWLKVRLDLHAPFRVIHLRGVHYLLVAVRR